MKTKRIAIFGGGIGGLSTAHWITHLLEDHNEHFEITIYEKSAHLGGKARSYRYQPGTSPGLGAPAEHGFRFFPGYYQWIDEIMKYVPDSTSQGCVFSHLTAATATQVLRVGQKPIQFSNRWTWHEFRNDLCALKKLEIRLREGLLFALKLLHIYGRPRRMRELFEHMSWWSFVKAEGKSHPYQEYLADGMNVRTVAARGRDVNARTVGDTVLRLISDWRSADGSDRVLDGPTSEVWIEPWRKHLENNGVVFEFDTKLVGFDLGDVGGGTGNGEKEITGAVVKTPARRKATLKYDYYVAAVPVEVMQKLVSDELRIADAQLAGLERLKTAWMTGIQFFLKTGVDLANGGSTYRKGHSIYMDSPWALTSIFQRQFWPDPNVDLGFCKGEKVVDVLSVIISDWKERCREHNRPLEEHVNLDEVKDHVWGDVKAHLATAKGQQLTDKDLIGHSFDKAITAQATGLKNCEPLLINRPGDRHYRPEASPKARSGVRKLFLAADYVRTDTDLATMESAAEAAMKAAIAIIESAGLRPSPSGEQRIGELVKAGRPKSLWTTAYKWVLGLGRRGA